MRGQKTSKRGALSVSPFSFLLILLCFACNNNKAMQFGLNSRFHLDDDQIAVPKPGDADIDGYGMCCAFEGQAVHFNKMVRSKSGSEGTFIALSQSLIENELDSLTRNTATQMVDTSWTFVSEVEVSAYVIAHDGDKMLRYIYPETGSGWVIVMDRFPVNDPDPVHAETWFQSHVRGS